MKVLHSEEIIHRVPLPGCVEFAPGDRVRVYGTVEVEDADLPGDPVGRVRSSSLGWVSGPPCIIDGAWHVQVVCEGMVPINKLERLP